MVDYILFKHCFSSQGGYVQPERPDVCRSMSEAVETFKDAFRHLVGRKPTPSQVRAIETTGVVNARSGSLEYMFEVSKRNHNLTGSGILV